MTKEEQLKAIILTKYKSINAFAVSLNISPSTVNSVLRRGIDGASIQVMLKVFDALDLDIESARTDTLKEKKKDPPAPQSARQKDLVTNEEVEAVLVGLGHTKPGEHITDADLDFLSSVVVLIQAWFNNKGKQG